jgi:hypothetical protein
MQNNTHPEAKQGWAVVSIQRAGDEFPAYSIQAAVDPYVEKRRTVDPLPEGGLMIGFHLSRADAEREVRSLNRSQKQTYGYDHDAAAQ